jgi:hypothetical protein
LFPVSVLNQQAVFYGVYFFMGEVREAMRSLVCSNIDEHVLR